MSDRRHRRGVILVVVVVFALLASVGVMAALIIATSQARRSQIYKDRTRALYAAEAGIVWASQKLWVDPAFCWDDSATFSNGDPLINGIAVKVTVTNCGAGNDHQIVAKVVY